MQPYGRFTVLKENHPPMVQFGDVCVYIQTSTLNHMHPWCSTEENRRPIISRRVQRVDVSFLFHVTWMSQQRPYIVKVECVAHTKCGMSWKTGPCAIILLRKQHNQQPTNHPILPLLLVVVIVNMDSIVLIKEHPWSDSQCDRCATSD